MRHTKSPAKTSGNPVVLAGVEQRILQIRGTRVMLDRDLAALYGTSTKALNQAVRRNRERFPSDFMFQLTADEKRQVVTICDHLHQHGSA